MKVLFSGYHNPHFLTITEYMERAIERLGHGLYIFDDRQHIVPGRIRQRFSWINTLDRNYINRKMISLAKLVNPDIAIITGGHRINASTVETLKENGIRTVLWTIDAPIDFNPILTVAPYYDYIMCQGTEAVEILKGAGIQGAQWLPMGCDPYEHRSVALSQEDMKRYGSDIAFVGSYYSNRTELFEALAPFDFGIWGPGWNKLAASSPLRENIKGNHTRSEDWIKIYSASKIVVAIHYQDHEGRFPVYQASPRVFEAMSCGAFVICDRQRDVFSLFTDGKHLIGFDDVSNLIEKIKYFLEHEDERLNIARQGREEVVRNHTYDHRLKTLFSCIQ